MYSRWFSVAVIVLWLSTMSWLVTSKVLPPLLVGEPPGYGRIIEAQKLEPLVGWGLTLGGRRLGWALSTTLPLSSGATEVNSRVHFDAIPVRDVAPEWLHPLLGLLDRKNQTLEMDAQSTLWIDALHRLSRFESAVRFAPLQDPVKLRGEVAGSRLRLVLFADDSSHATEIHFPPRALLGGAFSPQTQLPGLRSGQTWTVPSYNPLRPDMPVEILQAVVEGTEPAEWGGRMEDVWLVVYRSDPGRALGPARPRGRLWVRRDGTVLKQEVLIFDSKLTFVRLPDDRAAALNDSAQDQWQVTDKKWKKGEPISRD